ncbi:hypothetical protein JOQ06_006685, partial [Pogonophryne albipinna]
MELSVGGEESTAPPGCLVVKAAQENQPAQGPVQMDLGGFGVAGGNNFWQDFKTCWKLSRNVELYI